VSDPGVITPILSPFVTTEYAMTINYGNCVLRDTLLVLVTDRDSLDCENLLLPTAFSPNGDGLNDIYSISNPFLVDELENWTIFDRNGATIFETLDPLEGWDGNVQGQAIPPGVFGYRLTYQCKGETYKKIGSFYLMR
jgi:gliding motility-associated-like protein